MLLATAIWEGWGQRDEDELGKLAMENWLKALPMVKFQQKSGNHSFSITWRRTSWIRSMRGIDRQCLGGRGRQQRSGLRPRRSWMRNVRTWGQQDNIEWSRMNQRRLKSAHTCTGFIDSGTGRWPPVLKDH